MRSLTSRKTPRPGLGLLGRAWRFFNDPEAPRPVRLLLLAALLYVVLPLDAIPDVAPVTITTWSAKRRVMASNTLPGSGRPYRGSRDKEMPCEPPPVPGSAPSRSR